MELYRGKERATIAELTIGLVKTIHSGRLEKKGHPHLSGEVEMLLLSGTILIGQVNGKPKTAAEAARALGIPRVTARRKLGDLEKRGIVERHGTRYFMVNSKTKRDDVYIDRAMSQIRRAAQVCDGGTT